MKKCNSQSKGVLKALLMVSSLTALFFISGCGDNASEPETKRIQKILLAGEWTVQTVTVNNVDQTNSLYKNLKITFSEGNFTSTGGQPVWPATGTWSFSDDSGKKIKRGDAVELTIIEVTDKKLVYTLPWTKTTLSSGRIDSLPGDTKFVMVRP
jgi:hypothetical protein